MAKPTSITLFVDSNEYSRYETGKEIITVYGTVTGGAPYNNEEILLEIVKARRTRDVVVASTTVNINSVFDPANFTATFDIRNVVDHDLLNLMRHGKYFIRASSLATKATAVIGSGPNGEVIVEASEGAHGNSLAVEVVVPAGTGNLYATSSGGVIQINLAVNNGVPVAAKNTAANVAAAINAYAYTPGSLDSVRASYSGNGSGSFSSAIPPVQFAGGSDEVNGETPDFNVRIITVDRLKKKYLFGIDLRSTKILQANPQVVSGIPGVEIIEISGNHTTGLFDLSYVYEDNSTQATSSVGTSSPNGIIDVEASSLAIGELGNQLQVNVLIPSQDQPLSVYVDGPVLNISLARTGGVLDAVQNTAANIANEINNLDSYFVATASGDGSGSLTAAQTVQLSGGVTSIVRTLSYAGGPPVEITSPGVYLLRRTAPSTGSPISLGGGGCGGSGLASQDYIKVRVGHLSMLPTHSVTGSFIIEYAAIDDDTLAKYIDESIAYVENDLLHVYLEPTVVTTERDPQTIQFAAGFNVPTPIYVDPDYDFITTPLTYFIPKTRSVWIEIQTPFMSVLRVESLYGQIAKTRVIDIDLSWIEISQHGGMLQLVPYNQETAFNFMGIVWVNALRGAIELPNFWQYTMVVGLREPPPDLQDLVGRYAAVQALTAAALAFRPGLGSVSLSRDGVSESMSYLNQQKYGIYTGTIQMHLDWIDKVVNQFKAKYRGVMLTVV